MGAFFYRLSLTLSRTRVIFSLKPPSCAKFSVMRSMYLCVSSIVCLISIIAILATVSSLRLSASDT